MAKTTKKNRAIGTRYFRAAKSRERILGPLKLLPGKWESKGTGWNMIALPFHGAKPPKGFRYRVLMNQYDEQLEFSFVDDNVPNRGIPANALKAAATPDDFDQKVVTLDYQQSIQQIDAVDFPKSGLAGGKDLAIHHEPGLWLFMKNETTDGLNVARLASVPHGNSLLALGKGFYHDGKPTIPPVNGIPIGPFEDLNTPAYSFEKSPYLKPYKHFIDKPYMGLVSGVPGFPGFSPNNMNAILQFANKGVKIKKTTVLSVDTTIEDGGISNIPFVVKQAEPVSMKSTFWIQELEAKGPDGKPKLRLQYSQVVMLDFFRPRADELPGRVKWPHISICTLDKVYE